MLGHLGRLLAGWAVPAGVVALGLVGQPERPRRAWTKVEAPPRLTYTLEPTVAGHFSRTRVTLTLQGSAGGRSTVLLPPGGSGGDSGGKSVRGLRAVSRGARLADTSEAGVKHVVHPPGEEVTLRYEVDQPPPPTAGARPKPYFYHFGEDLWVLPAWDKTKPVSVALRWENVPPGWAVCTSYGSGERQEVRDTLERFQHATYLGGDFRVRRFRVRGKVVTLATRGRLGFTDRACADFLRKLYAAEAAFWGDADFLYTLVVCYPTDSPAGNFGGEGRTNSFSVHLPTREGLGFGVKHLLAHELFHSWNPAKLRWDGEQAYWFTEGFTDYYAALILLRAGLCTLEDYLGFLNHHLKAYHLSPARNHSYRRLLRERDDHESDRLIYSRGLLQALNWNAAVRHATKGRRSLDDLMRDLLRAAREEKTFALTDRAIVGALRRYLGAEAEADLRRGVLGGETIRPRRDPLGPHIRLREVPTPTFNLGFDPASLRRRVIAGVRRGSNAHRAGLRDGQEVLAGGYSPGAADRPVELKVRAGGEEKTVKFYPRGPEVAVPQFRLKAGFTAEERAETLSWLGVPNKRE